MANDSKMVLTMRPTKDQQEWIEDLKVFLFQQTAAKAVMEAALNYKRLLLERDQWKTDCITAQRELSQLKQSIKEVKRAKKRLAKLAK